MPLHRISIGEYAYLDLDNDYLVRSKSITPLTRTELHIMWNLAEQLGTVVPRKELCRTIWDDHGAIGNYSRDELYVVVHRIRKKIEVRPRRPIYLLSVRGLGYVLKPILD